MTITAEQATRGTRIRVDMEATVTDLKGTNSTTQVRDTRRENNHFVFLRSDVVTGDKRPGGKISVKFDGVITGPYEGNTLVTTQVTDSEGYIHYLYLANSAITVIDESGAAAPKPEAPKPEVRKRPKGETTVSITRYNDTISSDDVRTLITELEEDAVKFAVVRVRNDEELETFDTEEEAKAYIDDEDYNPERVVVQKTADPDVQDELDQLRRLNDDGESNIDDWNYGVTLYRDSYIDEDFAKDRYEDLKPRGIDLDQPPFSFIDWDAYADLLKEDAPYITFDDVTYYAL